MILRRRRSRKKADSWQTIYMDLMTIIMVFFIILWSINQGKDDGISETIGDQTARLINLPGDVLFSAGQVSMSDKGKEVLGQLFNNKNGGVGLTFQDNGLSKRMLVIHGHTVVVVVVVVVDIIIVIFVGVVGVIFFCTSLILYL